MAVKSTGKMHESFKTVRGYRAEMAQSLRLGHTIVCVNFLLDLLLITSWVVSAGIRANVQYGKSEFSMKG
jgi:hypothetical protein